MGCNDALGISARDLDILMRTFSNNGRARQFEQGPKECHDALEVKIPQEPCSPPHRLGRVDTMAFVRAF